MPAAGAIRAGQAFVELFADDSRLVRGLRQAEKRLKAFGSRIQGVGLRVAGAGAAMLTPMIAAAKTFATMGDDVAKMAKRTGLSVEALSELQFVASQTGTDIKTLEGGFRRMQRSIYDAGRGLSTATDALKDLGLRFEDLDGLTPEDQFKLLAERISQVDDPTKRAAIAMSLFGRSGTALLPMFAQGAAGIEQLQAKARELGLTMSTEDAQAAEVFTDSLDKLWKAVKMGVFRVGAALAPTLTRLADILTRVVVQVGAWIDEKPAAHRHGAEDRRGGAGRRRGAARPGRGRLDRRLRPGRARDTGLRGGRCARCHRHGTRGAALTDRPGRRGRRRTRHHDRQLDRRHRQDHRLAGRQVRCARRVDGRRLRRDPRRARRRRHRCGRARALGRAQGHLA
jgi:hypothetical protein